MQRNGNNMLAYFACFQIDDMTTLMTDSFVTDGNENIDKLGASNLREIWPLPV